MDKDQEIFRLRRFLRIEGNESSQHERFGDFAEVVANLLGAENCSIMLAHLGRGGRTGLRVLASCGKLPKSASRHIARFGRSISGHVAESGDAVLVRDIDNSSFSKLAWRSSGFPKDFLSAPIISEDQVIGVINVNNRRREKAFSSNDLLLLSILALLLGIYIHANRLHGLFQSRFAQLALADRSGAIPQGRLESIVRDPEKISRMMASTFFREMTRAGFDDGQIIRAASQIISLLGKRVKSTSPSEEDDNRRSSS